MMHVYIQSLISIGFQQWHVAVGRNDPRKKSTIEVNRNGQATVAMLARNCALHMLHQFRLMKNQPKGGGESCYVSSAAVHWVKARLRCRSYIH